METHPIVMNAFVAMGRVMLVIQAASKVNFDHAVGRELRLYTVFCIIDGWSMIYGPTRQVAR